MKHVIRPNWINSDILNAIKQRRYFHKKKDSVIFRLWRRTVRKLIYKAKTHYCNTHINENKRNPEQLWNSLRELSGTSVSSNIPHLNDAEGNLITTYSKTADMLTHIFAIYIGTFLQTLQTAQISQHWLKSIPKSLNMYTNLLFLWSQFSL